MAQQDKAIEKVAEELYNWVGRYGAHQGVLWKDITDSLREEYSKEALFLLDEFFDYRRIDLSKLKVLSDEEIIEASDKPGAIFPLLHIGEL